MKENGKMIKNMAKVDIRQFIHPQYADQISLLINTFILYVHLKKIGKFLGNDGSYDGEWRNDLMYGIGK